ncbi:MAG: DUF1553 domain-containing protein [Balneolales bacterium]
MIIPSCFPACSTRQVHVLGTVSVLLVFILSGCSEGDEYADELNIPEVVDFNHDVRGILSESCFACHGPDAMARETELRLDTEEGAFIALGDDEDYYAIVPGKPHESDLYKRIISDDPDYAMPPEDSNLNLSKREIALLKKWIEQGAEFKPHWSFIPPEKAAPPPVEDEQWIQNPIDHFILARLEDRDMAPSPRTDRETLLRRVSFDLTGLPPTLEDLDRFLSDRSPDAYEKAVDRLLASPAYGERMAMEWLDVARYADTHGYQDDGPNEMWPWRDWVIDAFNRNMPFDQFTTWQLAGDLFPEPTLEQKLATGFNRVHMQSQEGGIVEEEYRVEYVAERVYGTATAFMGLTMQCARCHDHKFDPISEKEYYRFSAFFNNVDDRGQIPNKGAAGPTILLPDSAARQQIDYLKSAITEQEQNLRLLREAGTEGFGRWQPTSVKAFRPEDHGLVAYLSMDAVQGDTAVAAQGSEDPARISGTLLEVEGTMGGALEFEKGNHINLGRKIALFERTDPFSFSFWINPSDTSREVPVLVKTGSIHIGNRGYDVSLFENRLSLRLSHGWPFNALQVKSVDTLPTNVWSHITVTYDGSSRAGGVTFYINGDTMEAVTLHDNLFKKILIDPEEPRYGGQNLLIGERSSFEDIRYKGLRLDEIKIFGRRLSAAEVLVLAGRGELSEILALAPEQYTDRHKELLLDHYLLRHNADYTSYLDKLQALRIEESNLTDTLREVMVMRERIIPRPSFIRMRGQYDNLGEEVDPGVPGAVLEFGDDLPQNRLGLARWLLSADNPLTSRVLVNRYWQLFFGQGIVDTPDDFGNQGSMPTHPHLLDWLAVTFRENGWNMKELHKMMVLSETYRQSSVVRPELVEKDPQNKLLARGPRYRLPAEMVRDNALVASGLIVDQVGGPSVKPYQPEGLWQETTSGRHLTDYVQDHGDSLYRRSLYTFWKRTSPPPGMTTFDASIRSHPEVKRQHTSTPLQALHTLNDPIYVEASRMLAERMMKEGGQSLGDQITFAFRAATSRKPSERELEIVKALYEEELRSYQAEPERSAALLSVGEYPLDETLDTTELAARTMVASTILNLDKTITKE